MSKDIDDFFEGPSGPIRDRWGRPMLFPAGVDTSDESNRVPYTRASSLSDYLDDFFHINRWKMRYLARALGQNKDLAMLAGAEPYTTGFDKGDEKENRASGARLDEIINRALERRRISEKADYGTVIHGLTEPDNDGNVEDKQVEADVASFRAALVEHGFLILGTELFIANDALRVAGTFDHLLWHPTYGVCIGDKKTSSSVHGESFRIQLASYAHGDLYDWESDARLTLEEYVERLGFDPDSINRKDGLIMWVKNGKTEILRLDLEAGLEAAHHAAWVRDNQRRGKHKWPVESEPRSGLKARLALAAAIPYAATESAVRTLYYAGAHFWDDQLTEIARERIKEIGDADV